MNTTEGVRDLVTDVLQTISAPYSEDVIEDVFVAIQRTDHWHKRYDDLCEQLKQNPGDKEDKSGKYTVNQWIGKYTKQLTGLESLGQADAQRTDLTETYTKLKAR